MAQFPTLSLRSVRLGSGIVLSIALLFTILALATPAWIVGANHSFGLFQVRSDDTVVDVVRFDEVNVTIAFIVIAMISLVPASVLVIVAAKVKEQEKQAKIGGAVAVVAAVSLLIAMSVYTDHWKDRIDVAGDFNWGYSYVLGWVAFCLTLIVGPVAIFAN